MTLLARAVLVFQLLLMLPALLSLSSRPLDFGALGTMALLVPIGGAASLFGAWLWWFHPVHRRVAAAIVVTPFVGLLLPVVLQRLIGGPVPPWTLIVFVLVSIVVAAAMLLGKAANWRAGGVFATRKFNRLLLTAMVALLVLLWAPALGWLALREVVRLPAALVAPDAWVRGGATYLGAVAVPALLLSCFALIYAPLGLVRSAGARSMHGGQLTCALLTLASLALAAFGIGVAAINPG